VTTTTANSSAVSHQQPTAGILGSLTPVVLMVLAFYFLILRPQQKREAKRRELINSIKKGDKIVTSGGILGIVHKIVGENEISLEIAESTRIRILKNFISEVLEKNTNLGKENELEDTQEESKTSSKKKK
jgi:preprotein translocase subunit YajC